MSRSIEFNNDSVKQVLFQKHLCLYLGSKWDFGEHLQKMFRKENKSIGLLQKLPYSSPRAPLVTIDKWYKYKATSRLRGHFI